MAQNNIIEKDGSEKDSQKAYGNFRNDLTVEIIGTEYRAEERLRNRTLQLDSLMMFITKGTDAFNGLDSADRDYIMELVRDVAGEMRHLAELINDAKLPQAA